MRILKIMAMLLVAAGIAAWTLMPGGGRIDPSNAAQVALGREVYAAHCASCHGANLEGQPDWRTRKPDGRMPAPPHDASGHTWHHTDDALFATTREGFAKFAPAGYQTDMPAFGGVLTDGQIRAVLSYIKSVWPPEIQARQSARTQQAKE